MNYGRAIRIVRTAYGLSQAELAKRLSVGASHLSLIESGKRQPSVTVLREIATALAVPMHLLTLLASDRAAIENPENAKQISEMARALLQLLVGADEQPSLPLASVSAKRKKSA
jgi:transcriptional regulator with XRE-family HTH domain